LKKAISLVLVLVVVLSCVGLVACAGRGESETPSSNGGTTSTSGGEAPPPSVGGLTWDDMPVYAGAEQIQKASWAIPATEGDWSKVEWRYYRMEDALNDVGMVAMFYRMEMPKNGWQEMRQMEKQDMSWSYYSKNDEKDGAAVWISYDEGKTVFALMRATG